MQLLKVLENLFISLVILLAPLQSVMVSIIVLVVLDTILGVIAARSQKEPITSHKLKRMVAKLGLYYTAVLVGFVAGNYLIDALIPIEKMITTLIGIVEVKSVLENLDIIYGGSFFKSLLDKLDKKQDEDKE